MENFFTLGTAPFKARCRKVLLSTKSKEQAKAIRETNDTFKTLLSDLLLCFPKISKAFPLYNTSDTFLTSLYENLKSEVDKRSIPNLLLLSLILCEPYMFPQYPESCLYSYINSSNSSLSKPSFQVLCQLSQHVQYLLLDNPKDGLIVNSPLIPELFRFLLLSSLYTFSHQENATMTNIQINLFGKTKTAEAISSYLKDNRHNLVQKLKQHAIYNKSSGTILDNYILSKLYSPTWATSIKPFSKNIHDFFIICGLINQTPNKNPYFAALLQDKQLDFQEMLTILNTMPAKAKLSQILTALPLHFSMMTDYLLEQLTGINLTAKLKNIYFTKYQHVPSILDLDTCLPLLTFYPLMIFRQKMLQLVLENIYEAPNNMTLPLITDALIHQIYIFFPLIDCITTYLHCLKGVSTKELYQTLETEFPNKTSFSFNMATIIEPKEKISDTLADTTLTNYFGNIFLQTIPSAKKADFLSTVLQYRINSESVNIHSLNTVMQNAYHLSLVDDSLISPNVSPYFSEP